MTDLALPPLDCTADGAVATCFHCGEAVPRGASWSVVIDDMPRAMCCAGCAAVAETILAHGLQAFYRERQAPAPGPVPLTPALRTALAALDEPALAAQYGPAAATPGVRAATLTLGSLSCAACAWLIERRLRRLPGVVDCTVNFATRHARVAWRPADIRFSAIVTAVRELGFDAAPLAAGTRHAELSAEYRRELRRFGIAALCAMQVMMIAAGLYFDAFDDGERLPHFLNWLCASFSVPVVTYCAWPFYQGAWRALRARAVSMDVPVTLGIVLGFGGSVDALSRSGGPVYFDSVTMFVSLLLLSRLTELSAWRRSSGYLDDLARVEPLLVERLAKDGGNVETVSSTALRLGDRLRIAAGATLPCDGRVIAGASAVDERLLTGEGAPRLKRRGDRVIGGSTNIESMLEIEVVALGDEMVLARIASLAREAFAKKPAMLSQAQAAAARFIGIVLVLAAVTVAYHGLWRGEAWLAPTLAVLVISCPCALALAVPTAFSVAIARLLRDGVLVARPDALTQLAGIRRLVFDKTGTLTTGMLQLAGIEPLDDAERAPRLLGLAAALAEGSAHPIARALQTAATGPLPAVIDRMQTTGYGVEGQMEGTSYLLGSAAYLRRAGIAVPAGDVVPALKVSYLAGNGRVIARFCFTDEIRQEAAAAVRYFAACGVAPSILSGDRAPAVAALAASLGIADARPECDPGAKLAHLEMLMGGGARVAVVGDGINDAPILARADVGITFGAASNYAKLNADLVLLKPDLHGLVTAHRIAQRLRRIVTQNVRWALAYNGVALPLALAGVVAPWVAALLMVTSSLVVVVNASRLSRGLS